MNASGILRGHLEGWEHESSLRRRWGILVSMGRMLWLRGVLVRSSLLLVGNLHTRGLRARRVLLIPLLARRRRVRSWRAGVVTVLRWTLVAIWHRLGLQLWSMSYGWRLSMVWTGVQRGVVRLRALRIVLIGI